MAATITPRATLSQVGSTVPLIGSPAIPIPAQTLGRGPRDRAMRRGGYRLLSLADKLVSDRDNQVFQSIHKASQSVRHRAPATLARWVLCKAIFCKVMVSADQVRPDRSQGNLGLHRGTWPAVGRRVLDLRTATRQVWECRARGNQALGRPILAALSTHSSPLLQEAR